MKFNTIEEKLPEINKAVVICNKDLEHPRFAILRVYTAETEPDMNPRGGKTNTILKDGDIFWRVVNLTYKEFNWMAVEQNPYWIYIEDLLNETIGLNETNRFEILDL